MDTTTTVKNQPWSILMQDFKEREAARNLMLLKFEFQAPAKYTFVLSPCKHLFPTAPCGNRCPKCGVVLTRCEKIKMGWVGGKK